jgi:hypothetical protein
MKAFLKRYGEVPGGVFLLLLTLFQINFVNHASEQDLLGRILFLEDGYIGLCSSYSQAIAALKGIDYELRELKQIGVGIPSDVQCKFYVDPTPQSPGHLPWPQAHLLFSRIEKWMAVLGAALFVGGLMARLALNSDGSAGKRRKKRVA